MQQEGTGWQQWSINSGIFYGHTGHILSTLFDEADCDCASVLFHLRSL